MEKETGRPAPNFLWPGVLVIFLSIYGYVKFRPPLESVRPEVSSHRNVPAPPSPNAIAAVHARLWEDPLAVAYENERLNPQPPIRKRERIRRYFGTIASSSEGKLLVMPVLVSGGPYPDDREQRLRTRYAVLSALGIHDFKLSLPARISYLNVPVDVDIGVVREKVCTNLIVPVKLYEADEQLDIRAHPPGVEPSHQSSEAGGGHADHDGDSHDGTGDDSPRIPDHASIDKVLVCWINESQLGSRPLGVIGQVLETMFDSDDKKHLKLKIIGPTNSDTLIAMQREDNRWNDNDGPTDYTKLLTKYDQYFRHFGNGDATIYSPRATVDPSVLRPKALPEFSLILPSSGEEMPHHANNTVAVAQRSDNRLHIRIFGHHGEIVFDSNESDFDKAHAQEVEELKDILNRLQANTASPSDTQEETIPLASVIAEYIPSFPFVQGLKDIFKHLQTNTSVRTDKQEENIIHLATSIAEYTPPFHFGNCGLHLRRAVGSDRALAESLCTELRLRDALPHVSKNGNATSSTEHVVLLTERDTLYGRAFPEVFHRASGLSADQLHIVKYLRGLDGKTGRSVNEEAGMDKPAESSANDSGPESAEPELPQGPGQLDYLRRMARQVIQLQEDLRHEGKDRIAAIGVVGTDVYDKLLILRALRKHFPRAWFFTTDLDAVFSHESERDYTRNLLVASHFALRLHPDIQHDVPPFRDSYQTATFFATLLAIDLHEFGALSDKVKRDPWGLHASTPQNKNRLRPLVFEIGRKRAFQLMQRDINFHLLSATNGIPERAVNPVFVINENRGKLHVRIFGSHGSFVVDKGNAQLDVPQSKRSALQNQLNALWKSEELTPRQKRSLLLEASSIVGQPVDPNIVLHPFGPQDSAWVSAYGLFGHLPRYAWLLAGLLGLVACCVSLFRKQPWAATYSKRPHWLRWLLESTFRYWLVLTAFGIPTLALAGVIWWDHTSNKGEPFAISEGISIWPSTLLRLWAAIISVLLISKGLSRLKDNRGELEASFIGQQNSDTHRSLRQMFRHYSRRERAGQRLGRVALLSFCYLLFGASLFMVTDFPSLPYRGTTASILSLLILVMAVIGMVALVFFVLDTTNLCRQFVHQISDCKYDGSWTELDRFADEHALVPQDAHGLMIVRLIADRTEVVGRLVFYPFIVLLLMFFSRSSFFDYLDYPWPLILIQGMMFLALVVSALLLHYQAINARDKVLETLRGHLAYATGMGDLVRQEQVGQLVRDIRQEHKGAFTPLTYHPLLKALAIPTGGASALLILENFLG